LSWDFSWAEFHEVKHFSIGVSITEVLNSAAVFIDKLIIGKFTNMTTLAIFDKGQQTSRLPVKLFSNAFDVILYSVFSKLQTNKDNETTAFLRLSSLLWIFVVILSIILYTYAHHIVVVLLGAKWMETIPILKIFAIAMPSLIIVKTSDAMLRAANKVYLTSRLKAVYVLCIIASALMAYKHDLTTISWYICLSYIIHLILVVLYSCKMLKISFSRYLSAVMPAILISFISILLHWFLVIALSDYTGRLVMIVIAVICQVLLLLVLARLSDVFIGKENIVFLNKLTPDPIKTKLRQFKIIK